jgi:hypothetical protein
LSREKRDITEIASPSTKVVAMKSTAPTSTIFSRSFEKLFTGVALTFALGLVVQGLVNPIAHSSEVPASRSLYSTRIASVPSTAAKQPLQDGTYLYGQSSKAEQVGMAYLVFEVNRNKVVGAFYMPQSSFDCFHGNLKNNELALTIVNSYERTSYPYEVALKTEAASASEVNPTVPTGLEGYQPLNRLSDNDQRILSTCRANFAAHL